MGVPDKAAGAVSVGHASGWYGPIIPLALVQGTTDLAAMDPAEITHTKRLQIWLSSRSRADAIAIAARGAMRSLPVFGRAMDRPWADRADLTAMPLLRVFLTSGVARQFPIAVTKSAATDASNAAVYSADSASNAAAEYAARAAVYLGQVVNDDPAMNAVRVVEAVDVALASMNSIFYQIQNDAKNLAVRDDPFAFPLWSESYSPDWFLNTDRQTRAIWAKDPPGTWNFWIRWWDGVLTGKQLDWELQKAIVLGVSNDDWAKDPAHIAGVIAGIEERFELRRQIAELQRQLSDVSQNAVTTVASGAQRSHNNPPELIEPPAEIVRELPKVLSALQEADTELRRPKPRPAILRKVGRVLLAAAARVAAYCGTLADVALKEGAKTVGTAGMKLVLVFLAASTPTIQSIGEALISLAQRILSGG
jgi:hypothetical protein